MNPERLVSAIQSGERHTLIEWFRILSIKASFDDEDRVFTMNEWAAAAGISPRTARELVAAGKVPFVQLSHNRIGIRACDHRDWLEARTRKREAREILGA
jgi:hypothetical protein